jgi:hypothetical protein
MANVTKEQRKEVSSIHQKTEEIAWCSIIIGFAITGGDLLHGILASVGIFFMVCLMTETTEEE